MAHEYLHLLDRYNRYQLGLIPESQLPENISELPKAIDWACSMAAIALGFGCSITSQLSRSYTMQDSKELEQSQSDKTRQMIWDALEGQRFLCVVVDGQLRMQPLADGTMVVTPKQALDEALHMVHKSSGRDAVVEELLKIKECWPSEFKATTETD